MTESVIDHAGPVIGHAGNRLQSVIDHRHQQVAKANVRYRAPPVGSSCGG